MLGYLPNKWSHTHNTHAYNVDYSSLIVSKIGLNNRLQKSFIHRIWLNKENDWILKRNWWNETIVNVPKNFNSILQIEQMSKIPKKHEIPVKLIFDWQFLISWNFMRIMCMNLKWRDKLIIKHNSYRYSYYFIKKLPSKNELYHVSHSHNFFFLPKSFLIKN